MNNTINELFKRKSVRVFENREISEEDEKLILQSAIMAPTAGNQQMFTILKITDSMLKSELAVKCDNQGFIKDAKLVLIFLADFNKWIEIFRLAEADPRNVGMGDMFLAIDDALIAAQNAVVAAESLGIGSCYIGDIMENYEEIKAMLNLPEYVFPAAMLVFGYPTEGQKNRIKPQRAELESIVQENRYERYTEKDLYKLTGKSGGDFSKIYRAFCKRKYNSDFAKELNRSVEVFIRSVINCK